MLGRNWGGNCSPHSQSTSQNTVGVDRFLGCHQRIIIKQLGKTSRCRCRFRERCWRRCRFRRFYRRRLCRPGWSKIESYLVASFTDLLILLKPFTVKPDSHNDHVTAIPTLNWKVINLPRGFRFPSSVIFRKGLFFRPDAHRETLISQQPPRPADLELSGPPMRTVFCRFDQIWRRQKGRR